MKIATTFGSSTDFKEAIDDIVAYEQAGLAAVWMGESYGYDAFTALGAVAQATNTVELGPGIVNPYSRTPTLIAMSAAGLDALSGGRATLGLGTSGPGVIEGWHGVPYDKPITRLKETMEICRTVWRKERLDHSGAYQVPLNNRRPLKLIQHPPRTRIPIYLASLGPKSVELTASDAEGWLPIMFWPEKAGDIWGESLQKGLNRRDSALGELSTVAPVYVAIDEHIDDHLERLRAHSAHYIGGMGPRGQNYYHDLFANYGFPELADEIQDLYLGGKKAEAAAIVPEEYLHGVSMIGTAEHVRERLAAFGKAGVDMINVTPAGESSQERATQISKLMELAG